MFSKLLYPSPRVIRELRGDILYIVSSYFDLMADQGGFKLGTFGTACSKSACVCRDAKKGPV